MVLGLWCHWGIPPIRTAACRTGATIWTGKWEMCQSISAPNKQQLCGWPVRCGFKCIWWTLLWLDTQRDTSPSNSSCVEMVLENWNVLLRSRRVKSEINSSKLQTNKRLYFNVTLAAVKRHRVLWYSGLKAIQRSHWNFQSFGFWKRQEAASYYGKIWFADLKWREWPPCFLFFFSYHLLLNIFTL